MKQAVLLPQFPEAWQGADIWEITWETDEGDSGKLVAGAGSIVLLDLPRGGSALIFARAMFGSNVTKPYGALWPQYLDGDGLLEPCASGGWCAGLALPLMRAGWDLRGFNWKRLDDELCDTLPDPWVLDPASLCASLIEGKFRSDYLREPKLKLEKKVPGVGQVLYPASPWGQVLVPDANGVLSCSVSPGSYAWMNSAYCLRMSVSALGEAQFTVSVFP